MPSEGGYFFEKWMNEMEHWIESYRKKEYPGGDSAYGVDIDGESVDAWYEKQFPVFCHDLLDDLDEILIDPVLSRSVRETLVKKIRKLLKEHQTEAAIKGAAIIIDILACEGHTVVRISGTDEEEIAEFLQALVEKHPRSFTEEQKEAIQGLYANKEWQFPIR